MPPDRLDLEVKFDPGDAGTFTGRASIFGDPPDRYGDVIANGAFKRSLDEHRAAGTAPLLLWQHRADEPIGTWTSLRETRAALEVEGRLVLETQRGREAYELMKAGALNGLSIGFTTRQSEARKGGRLLRDLDLVEISVVSLPAASRARVMAVRNDPMTDDVTVLADDAPPAPDPIETRLAEVETKIEPVAELTTRLDRIETRLSRPSSRIEVREDQAALETKAFVNFLRKGREGLNDLEKKVLSVSLGGSPTASTGFELVPEVFLRELIRNLVLVSPMRQVARVQTVSGGPVLIPKRTGELTGKWVSELVQHDTSQPSYEQQSVGIFECRVTVEITNQLLEDAAFDLASEMARDLAEEFARLEGAAFVGGNGTSQPEGFLVSPDFGNNVGAVTADSLIDLYHSVPSAYAGNGTWLMNRSVMGTVRKLKTTGTGVYLWADSLVPGNPPTILGRPVVEMPGMAGTQFSPAQVAVAFGDWSQGYRIFDRVGIEILRDPFTLARKSQVAFHARKRVGGAIVNGEAVKGLNG